MHRKVEDVAVEGATRLDVLLEAGGERGNVAADLACEPVRDVEALAVLGEPVELRRQPRGASTRWVQVVRSPHALGELIDIHQLVEPAGSHLKPLVAQVGLLEAHLDLREHRLARELIKQLLLGGAAGGNCLEKCGILSPEAEPIDEMVGLRVLNVLHCQGSEHVCKQEAALELGRIHQRVALVGRLGHAAVDEPRVAARVDHDVAAVQVAVAHGTNRLVPRLKWQPRARIVEQGQELFERRPVRASRHVAYGLHVASRLCSEDRLEQRCIASQGRPPAQLQHDVAHERIEHPRYAHVAQRKGRDAVDRVTDELLPDQPLQRHGEVAANRRELRHLPAGARERLLVPDELALRRVGDCEELRHVEAEMLLHLLVQLDLGLELLAHVDLNNRRLERDASLAHGAHEQDNRCREARVEGLEANGLGLWALVQVDEHDLLSRGENILRIHDYCATNLDALARRPLCRTTPLQWAGPGLHAAALKLPRARIRLGGTVLHGEPAHAMRFVRREPPPVNARVRHAHLSALRRVCPLVCHGRSLLA